MQDGRVDEKNLDAEIYEHSAMIGRQVWSSHHGPNRASCVETKRREEGMERARAGPACAARAEFQPGFKEIFRCAAGQRGCICHANVDEFADIVERDSLAPCAVNAAQRIDAWSGTIIETQPGEDAFDELFWQPFCRVAPASLNERTYGHLDSLMIFLHRVMEL